MKTRIYLISGVALLGMLFTSCDEKFETECFSACCQQVIISTDEYTTAPNDDLNITSVQLDGDCLTIFFEAGGCDGNSWMYKLIDADVVMESYPPQRNLRLSLKNNELCKAVVTKGISYNISDLKIKSDKIMLNIINSGDQILYEY